MLFTPSSRNLVSQLFTTHPPITKRIQRLDPSFSLDRLAERHDKKRDMVREARRRERAEPSLDGPWGSDTPVAERQGG